MARPESETPRRKATRSRLLPGVLGGGVAWAFVGLVDSILGWGPSSQFVPELAPRLWFVAFSVASHALTGAAVGAVLALAVFVLSRTSLADLYRGLTAKERRAEALAMALLGPFIALGLSLVAHRRVVALLGDRQNVELQLAVVMFAGAALVGLVVVSTTVAAAPLAFALRWLGGRVPFIERISSGRFVALVLGVVASAGAATILAVRTWDTLELLPLRPAAVALGALLLMVPGVAVARRLSAWLVGRRLVTAAILLLFVSLSSGVMLYAGALEGVRQSLVGYTGMGGLFLSRYRVLVDFDRDGYSPILGGGDCDDFDAEVNPAGREIPGDGIDQNCIGGDADPMLDFAGDSFATVPESVPDDLSVLLITIDTVRADHFGLYGYGRPTTPQMDRLAADSVIFENGWAHSPGTRLSMPAIFTGRHPLLIDYDETVSGWPGLRPTVMTMAELLSEGDLETVGIANHHYFSPARRLNQGFDVFRTENARLHRGQGAGTSSEEQTDSAIEQLDRLGDGQFHMWVHFYDPHHPYEAHDDVPDFGGEPKDLYDQEIRLTDTHVGRLLDALRARGRDQDTIVIITGDHGEEFNEHGDTHHGYHLYPEQTRVPFIMRVPGIAPRRVQTAVGHVDILPTVANLVGLPANEQMTGRSLVGLMIGEEPEDPDRYVIQQVSFAGTSDIRGAVSARCHVIYNVRPHTSWELYNRQRDPGEQRNIIDTPGECAGAREVLETWLDSTEAPFEERTGAEVRRERPDIERPLDVDVGDELRLLSVELPEGPHRRGRPLEITWTWETRRTLEGRYRVFVHLFGEESGRILGDYDPPRPFAWWEPGDFVRYTRPVTIPRTAPPGTYRLHFGVYEGGTRKELKSEIVTIDRNSAAIGTVEIIP